MSEDTHQDPGWATVDTAAGESTQSPEEKQELKKKNYVIAGALLLFVILIFFVTIAKLSSNFGA